MQKVRWKHLHVCGENSKLIRHLRIHQETPPRMWRKLSIAYLLPLDFGNTSTYVEKTLRRLRRRRRVRKHLHVCGENGSKTRKRAVGEETPPRMWRKLQSSACESSSFGNTSTYVEKTLKTAISPSIIQKHLHVCGENSAVWKWAAAMGETPPRMWRKQRGQRVC